MSYTEKTEWQLSRYSKREDVVLAFADSGSAIVQITPELTSSQSADGRTEVRPQG